MEDYVFLKIRDIITETQDAATFIFEDQLFEYKPGQFLTLVFDINDHEIRRSYSISSAPEIDKAISITVKKIQNGEISRYLLNNARVGDLIRSLPPAGRFTIRPSSHAKRDIFLFAAGSGIVPLFSILKSALYKENESKIHLIYSNRNQKSIIFFKQLSDLQQEFPDRFSCLHILSNPTGALHNSMHAHLNNFLVEELVNQQVSFRKELAEFYICGPFAYMRMVRIMLRVSGFSADQIYKENFISESVVEERQLPADNVEAQVKIKTGEEEYQFIVPKGIAILKAARDHGIRIPYSCQGGICASCVVKCTSGKIEMTVNEVLTNNEIAEGLVLTCVGYPTTVNVEITL